MNRRLIRPSLTEIKEKIKTGESLAPRPHPSHGPHPPSHPPHGAPSAPPVKKSHPPTDTSAETYYYLKQMSKKTPMAVVFQDGERIEGYIEWYDRNCIKLNRDDAPNLLVYKGAIKYMYKLSDGKDAPEANSETGEK
jgi:host factor-I protein